MDLMVLTQPNIGSAFHVGVATLLRDDLDSYEQHDLRYPGVRLKRDLLTLFLHATAFARGAIAGRLLYRPTYGQQVLLTHLRVRQEAGKE
jgi:hypothetical protein